MRHRKRRGKLKVSPSHNQAMRRNLVAALIEHGRITTTVAKAKAFRSYAEKLITLAVKGHKQKELGTVEGKAAHLHAVRRAAQLLPHKPAVKKLFNEVAPAVGDRPGGYTRILRYDKARLGDRAPLALFELVDREAVGAPEPTEEETAAS
ncbi:MAG: 50S ribosomal protein L17 [Planctomycetota bacterium]|jgi:large subunit ribosomal protein L17